MFIFQNTRWLKAFMGDPFKSCTVTVMRNVKSLDGDRHQKRGWTGWNPPYNFLYRMGEHVLPTEAL